MREILEHAAIADEDRIVLGNDGLRRELWLVSKEVMVVQNGEGQMFSPVRIQSCMHPENVRVEPVGVLIGENEEIRIKWIAGECCFAGKDVELFFHEWTPEIPDGHCGDCTKCRRCWA